MVKLVVEIYESGRNYPAVVHIFEGKSKDEANQYYKAHLRYDRFLGDAISKGNFQGMSVAVQSYYV